MNQSGDQFAMVDKDGTHEIDQANFQQFIIQEIVVQNDLNVQEAHQRTDAVSTNKIFADDESQSDVLFPVGPSSREMAYRRDVVACNIQDTQPTIFLPDSSVAQTIGFQEGDQVTFSNALQANNIILHTESNGDSLLLDNVDSNLLRSNIPSTIMFSDGSTSHPFTISSPIPRQPVTIQPENDDGANFIVHYTLPTNSIQLTSQSLPLLQYAQAPRLQDRSVISSKDASNDGHVYLTTEQPITNSQPVVLAPQTADTFQPPHSAIVAEQPLAFNKKQKFFIQGGNAQNTQLLQQVLAMWGGGEGLVDTQQKVPDKHQTHSQVANEKATEENAEGVCNVVGHKCSICSKLFQTVNSSTQTDHTQFNVDKDINTDEIYPQNEAMSLIGSDVVDLHNNDSVDFVNNAELDNFVNVDSSILVPIDEECNRQFTQEVVKLESDIPIVTSTISSLVTPPVTPAIKRRKLTLMKVGATNHKCKFCNLEFKRLAELMSHVKENHPEHCNGDSKPGRLSVSFTIQQVERSSKEDYECDVCHMNFVNFYSLRLHSYSHSKCSYRCEQCDLVFVSSESLSDHSMAYHAVNRVSCKKCGETFASSVDSHDHACYFKPVSRTHCGLCEKSFASRDELKLHVVKIHKKTAKPRKGKISNYECPECKYVCFSWAVLEAHMRIHSGERPFVCEICSKRFTFKHVLKRHVQSHSGVKLHACSVCENSYSDARTLRLHMAVHTKACNLECDLCDKKFTWAASLQRHKLTHNPNHVPERYICDHCGKIFTNKYSSIVHNRLHTGERPFSCELCGKGFIDQRTLKFHRIKHTGERPHQCTVCGKRYARIEGLKIHQRTHSTVKMFSCAQCQKGFNTQQGLTNHVRSHTGDKPFMCDMCPRKFPSINSLRKHTTRHSSDRPFACDQCDKAFKEKYVLQVHQRTHMTGQAGDKQFKCQVCGQRFRQSCTLTVHMRRHTGEKPYRCDVCHTHFSTTSSLHRHARIHTGDCPYQCELCDKKFRLIAGLKSHVQRHHKDAGKQTLN